MTSVAVTSLLAGESVPWSGVGASVPDLLQFCLDENLAGLVHRRVRGDGTDWPAAVRDPLEQAARSETARELLRQRELTAVLDALGTKGIQPVLFKGTALAYLAYESAELRPRNDTDLLIQRDQVDQVRDLLKRRGYLQPTYCDGELLFCQFELQRTDEFGLLHALDFHWKISMQTLFADLLSYEEMLGESVAIPALGANARGAGPVHALLVACIHPVMHHRGVDRIIWLYDIHLLASRLSRADWDRFVDCAVARQVGAIAAHQLRSTRDAFGTAVPGDVLERLAPPGSTEPTAAYLAPDRRWGDELVSNVRGLKSWGDRARLLREIAFPSATYMLKSYGMTDGFLERMALPGLYAHRGVMGVLKVLRGAK